MDHSSRRNRQTQETYYSENRTRHSHELPMHPHLPPVSANYETDRSQQFQNRQYPQSRRTPSSPPYQEAPKLPPISTVLGQVSRPSSPPVTPGGQSATDSPVKRGSQDYGTDALSSFTDKRLKIDSLVDDLEGDRSPVQSRSDRRSSVQTHSTASPRPKLPSFEQTFPSMYPSQDDRSSSAGNSHRASYSYDPYHYGPPTGRDVMVTAPARRHHSRSPPRMSTYQGHQRSSTGPGYTYPIHSVPLIRTPTTSPLPYHASHPPEAHPTTYYTPHYGGYPEGYRGPPHAGSTQSVPVPVQSYGDAGFPHQYSWPAVPGAADSHNQRRRRGNLPREATALMKKWFNEHLKSPYPSEEEKMQFCEITGLSMNQVGNWFINARRRHPEMRENRGSMSNQNSQESNEDV